MAEFKEIESWLDALVNQLSPAQRRRLMRDVATRLRQQQQQNIRMQKNPDGTAYEPRRVNARNKAGRVRRMMFRKLRTARYLKARITASTAAVEFDGAVQRIARVHHYGLRDRVRKNGPEVTYAKRELLGINDSSETMIRDLLITHLAK